MLTPAQDVIAMFTSRKIQIATAESCTGGLICAALTDVAGSSAVVDRGFVTYSNAAKHEMLGVPVAVLQAHGAVSAEVAQAMAEGALLRSRAEVSIAVTGIAGPGGGTIEKPVGLVFLASARREGVTRVERQVFRGDRAQIRERTVERALEMILERG
jgi:nicotinamide-nucleotide amidase